MKVFYVIYIKDNLTNTIIDGIRILADPYEKQRAHITVRGPYDQEYHLTQKNEIIKHTKITIDGVDTFFNDRQSTIFLKVKQTNEALKNVWKKDFYKGSFNPHLTIYDGKSREFATKLLTLLKKYDKNFHFDFEVKELEPLFSAKGQSNNNFAVEFDFKLLSTFLGEEINLDKIRQFDDEERLKRIEILGQNFQKFKLGRGVSSKLDNLFKELDYNTDNGLFYYSDPSSWQDVFPYRITRAITEIKPYAFFSLLQKSDIQEVNGKHPHPFNEPIILFFTDLFLGGQDESEIHKKVFSLGKAPVIFIEKDTEIYIYNGLHFDKNNKGKLEKLDDFDNARNFSFNKLIAGETWKQYYKTHYKGKLRVDEYLLANISEARSILIKKGLTAKISNAILGRLIFNRYLIDRGVEINQKLIPGKNKEERNLSFLRLISSKGKMYDYFHYFNEHFKGELFPITSEEIEKINEAHLSILHKLFEGGRFHSDIYQPSLFDVYDFQVIPVELISNIYERFLGREKQEQTKAFYTPPFLVDYILAQTIQPFIKELDTTNCKVLDPSCGSGIFLIETLRKLIENYLHKKNERVVKDNKVLWKIVTENIFGIDIDPDAIDIAIFSLYITILDYKEPKDIKKIHFHSLRNRNFFCADFFDTKHPFNKRLRKTGLDFIIGNPPWGKIEESHYEEYCSQRQLKENADFNLKAKIEIGISDKQIAQAFVIRVSDFQIASKCAFLITSKVFYNNNAKTWRNYFLNNFLVEHIFELSPVRKEIFEEAIWPAAVLIFKPLNNSKNIVDFSNVIKHISLKPNRVFQYFKTIVIGKYDYKKVSQKNFMEKHGGVDWLWKILLYGNTFDYRFILRLKNSFPSIQQVISNCNLESSGGLKLIDGNKKVSAESIIGFDFLDFDKGVFRAFLALPSSKWYNKTVGYMPDQYFFSGMKLLVKKGLTSDFKAVASYSEKKIVFTDSVNSIKPNKINAFFDIDYEIVLKSLTGLFNSELFSYFIFHTGSSPGVDKPRAYFSEHFSFPAIIDKRISDLVDEIQLTNANLNERIFQDEGYLRELLHKLDDLIFELYKVDRGELNLIKYTREVLIPIVNRDPDVFLSVTDDLIKRYIDEFELYLEDVYDVSIFKHSEFIAVLFELSPIASKSIKILSVDNKEKLSDYIQQLSIKEVIEGLYIQKDVKGFQENAFYIIKPNERKNWHPAIAMVDIQELSFRKIKLIPYEL